jgi:hypothetical protein
MNRGIIPKANMENITGVLSETALILPAERAVALSIGLAIRANQAS